MNDVPEGFRLFKDLDKVMEAFAPIHGRQEADGTLTLGLRIGPQHCNPRGNCHGGTWASMADVIMGINVGIVTGMSGPTVSMSIDYLGAARTGQWVEGRARVLRASPKLGFADCVFTAEGEIVLRANAVFRRKWPPYLDFEQMVAD